MDAGQSWQLIERYIDYVNTPFEGSGKNWWGVGTSVLQLEPSKFLALAHFKLKSGDVRTFYYQIAGVPWELHASSEFLMLKDFTNPSLGVLANISDADGFSWTPAALFIYQVVRH